MIALTFSTGEAVLVNHSAGPLLFCLTKKRTVHYFVTMNYSAQQSLCKGKTERKQRDIYIYFLKAFIVNVRSAQKFSAASII